MIINFLTFEVYPDTLEKFLELGLRDYVFTHKNTGMITTSLCWNYLKSPKLDLLCNVSGDVIVDVKFRFVNLLAKAEGKKVLYFPDAYEDYKSAFDEHEDVYDYIFFPAHNSLIDNKRYFTLSLGYCPYTHYPIPQKNKKKTDVCFIGTKHNDRGWIKEIPNIKLYGNGWGNGVHAVYGADKRLIVAQSKILINYHVDEIAANMRDYELLAMGSFVLSDYVPECLKGGMVKYDDYEDLCAKTDYYLNHEEERDEIAKKGLELVAPYSYEHRWEQILQVVVGGGTIESD